MIARHAILLAVLAIAHTLQPIFSATAQTYLSGVHAAEPKVIDLAQIAIDAQAAAATSPECYSGNR